MTRLLSSLSSEANQALFSPSNPLLYPGSRASLRAFLDAPFADLPDSVFLEALKNAREENQPFYLAVKGKLKNAVIPDEDPFVETWFDNDMEEVRISSL